MGAADATLKLRDGAYPKVIHHLTTSRDPLKHPT